MSYITVITSALKQGDIVNAHGMRCLIDREILISTSHPGSDTRYTRALVLNRDDVPGAVVPLGWTREPNGEHRWTIQGNDLAHWHVEQ